MDMEVQPFVILGIKVKPGPIERHKIENFKLESTVIQLKTEAGKKANLPFDTLELIHHGKILKDTASLTDCGVRCGEMVHVVKKKVESQPEPPPQFTDPELQQLVTSLRTFGCTPSAPGWTRAMQALNDDATMSEILTNVPSLADDCVSLSIIHEVELLAALGASVHTMRRAAAARPALPAALRELARIVRTRGTSGSSENTAPTSGYAYSLEALSEDEDGEEEEEGAGGSQPRITREQLAVALQAATGGVGMSPSGHEDLLPYIRAARALSGDTAGISDADTTSRTSGQSAGGRAIITPDMFNEAITEAISMSNIASNSANTSSEQSSQSDSSLQDSTSTSTGNSTSFVTQLQHMHEMGLLDDRINIRALLVSGGDVNAAINLVFSGAMED